MTSNSNIRLAVDAVLFAYHDKKLFTLLVKRKYEPFQNEWALPGGFVLDEESLQDAVQREVKEETNFTINYLEQLKTFGAPSRDPRGRVVSVAFFGLVRLPDELPQAATDAAEAQWFELDVVQEMSLAFDHHDILKVAFARLQGKLDYKPIGFDLLPTKFLFSDLEQLYITVLGKEIDRRNFRKKVLSYDLLIETDESVSIGRGRPAKLFKFNAKRYIELEKDGNYFQIF
jgi:8-oxo-dGTP diphosphatase